METGSQATSEEHWKDDLIGRKEEAETVKNFLLAKLDHRESQGEPRSYVLNIDAPWGSGKSYFIDNFEKQLKAEGYLVAKVNAWIDDHSDDPLTSVLSAIELAVDGLKGPKDKTKANIKAIKKNAGKILLAGFRGASTKLLQKYLGDAGDEIAKLATDAKLDSTELDEAIETGLSDASNVAWDGVTDKLISQFDQEKIAMRSFRDGFAKLIAGLKQRNKLHSQVFVFIDELDRCRPDYAIRMLERVKHLFSVSGAVFLIATDTSQLHHAIRAVYGSGFDSEKYLLRFFDRQYHLQIRSALPLVGKRIATLPRQELLCLPQNDKLDDYFNNCASGFRLTLRDTEQVFDMLSDTLLVWSAETKIEIGYLLPIMMLKKTNSPLISQLKLSTVQDWRPIQNMLAFPLRTRFEDSTISAFQLFLNYHEHRNWDLDVLQTTWNSRQRTGKLDSWVESRIHKELLEAHKQTPGSERPPPLLGRYVDIVESISAFSR